ncbi:efflux RND transporter periplasmic adaptor subunit [Paracoccus sanguinis]|uniref:efflux RND transporter periplasmic adaptor subunit n=1 Tax=Paracoccus sanguinis TaxID=1545044 RepID=UPI0009E07BA9|nr:efflux RND transporter periplasmic adaptor subunit [Paracoccus sanguinis]
MRSGFLLLPLLLAAGVPLAAATPTAPSPPVAEAAPQAPAGGPLLAVEYVPVETRPLTLGVQLTGTIGAQDSIDLSFPNGGRITEILVEAGNRVSAGMPLARTDAVQQQQALNQAEAGVTAAEAAARQAGQAAEGQLESARTRADQARRALDDAVLKAPEEAVVTARTAEPGQVVGAAQPILSLAALTGLEAVFRLPDSPRLDAWKGAQVSLSPIDHPDRRLNGTVSEIAPLVDPATGSVTVRVAIDGPLDPALLGAAVVGTAEVPAGEGIELPWTALTVSGTSPAVWRIGPDDRVAIVPVEVERYETGVVVVRAGVTSGEVVVGEGSQLMYPGRQVRRGTPRP